MLNAYELDEHEALLLRQAVRVADTCEQMQCVVAAEGPLLNGRSHPALVELRQKRLLPARLVVALRVPMGETGTVLEDAPRTQRRGLRGVYGIRGGAA